MYRSESKVGGTYSVYIYLYLYFWFISVSLQFELFSLHFVVLISLELSALVWCLGVPFLPYVTNNVDAFALLQHVYVYLLFSSEINLSFISN